MMGRAPTGQRQYHITHIWDKTHEIIRLIVVGMGNKEIVEELATRGIKCTPQNISDIRNSDMVRSRLKVMHTERDADAVAIAGRIDSLAPLALDVMEGVLDGTTPAKPSETITAARDVLDRAGHSPVRKVAGEIAVGVFTVSELEQMKLRVKDAARRSGVIEEESEEVEYEEAST